MPMLAQMGIITPPEQFTMGSPAATGCLHEIRFRVETGKMKSFADRKHRLGKSGRTNIFRELVSSMKNPWIDFSFGWQDHDDYLQSLLPHQPLHLFHRSP